MSYGGNADPSGVQVTFLDQTGAKSVKAVIAFSVPVSRIIPNIITKMSLPATSPDGQPMSYSLDHKEGGRRLLESWTLVEANVQRRRPSDRLSRSRGRARPAEGLVRGRTECRCRSPRSIRSGRSMLSTHQEALRSTAGHSQRPCTNRLASADSITTWRPWSGFARKARSSGSTATGDPPQQYHISFQGKGLWRDSRQGQGSRSASCRDQAGGVLSSEHARDSLGRLRSFTPISPRSAWFVWGGMARTGSPACSSTNFA